MPRLTCSAKRQGTDLVSEVCLARLQSSPAAVRVQSSSADAVDVMVSTRRRVEQECISTMDVRRRFPWVAHKFSRAPNLSSHDRCFKHHETCQQECHAKHLFFARGLCVYVLVAMYICSLKQTAEALIARTVYEIEMCYKCHAFAYIIV